MNFIPLIVGVIFYLFYYLISAYNWFQIARLRINSSKQNIKDYQGQKTDDAKDRLLYAHRVVTDLTEEYNHKLQVFPTNLLAHLFGLKSL